MGQGMWIPSSSKPLIFWELGYLAAFYSVSVSSTPTTTTKKCKHIPTSSLSKFPKKNREKFYDLGEWRGS